jgi:hypothetical protein
MVVWCFIDTPLDVGSGRRKEERMGAFSMQKAQNVILQIEDSAAQLGAED